MNQALDKDENPKRRDLDSTKHREGIQVLNPAMGILGRRFGRKLRNGDEKLESASRFAVPTARADAIHRATIVRRLTTAGTFDKNHTPSPFTSVSYLQI